MRGGKITHGRTWTREYQIWCGIKQRCTNPNNPCFKDYGGRGISLCRRWNKFENFFADMGESPLQTSTIERKNNEKGYSANNCRWATRYEQSLNRRQPKIHIDNASGFKNVHFRKDRRTWYAKVVRNGAIVYRKTFRTKNEAAAALKQGIGKDDGV